MEQKREHFVMEQKKELLFSSNERCGPSPQKDRPAAPWPPPLDRDVKELLEGLKLDQPDFDAYAKAFSQQRVNSAAALVSLTPQQLYDCGVRLGHLALFAEAIRHLKVRLEESQLRQQALEAKKPKPKGASKDNARAAVFVKEIRQVIATLSNNLINLQEQCGLMVLAVLCKEHCLLLGPPGVAKSTLCERLFALFDVAEEDRQNAFFTRLLTRFTLPDELFGPVSLQLLKEDKYQRNTHRYLPQARVAFLDEIFKSNSAILNALLTILNERMFDNGVSRSRVPLMLMIAASNEYPPDSGELQALYDRFLFRSWIDPDYSFDSFSQLLNLPYDSAQVELQETHRLTQGMIEVIHHEATQTHLPDGVLRLMHGMNEALARMGKRYYVSPRRWKKIGFVLRVAAFCHARKEGEVCLSDCALLKHLAWQKHSQRETIWKIYKDLLETELTKLLPSRAALAVVGDNIAKHIWISPSDKKELAAVLAKVEHLLPDPTPPPADLIAPPQPPQGEPVPNPPTQSMPRHEAKAYAAHRLCNDGLYQQLPPDVQQKAAELLACLFDEGEWDVWPPEEIEGALRQVWPPILEEIRQ